MRQAERREAFHEALELLAELVDLLPADDQRWLEVLEAMYARAEWLIDHRAESDAAGRGQGAARDRPPARRAPLTTRAARSSSSGSRASSPGEPASSSRPTRPASRRRNCSPAPAIGARRCSQPASWAGSRACAETLSRWPRTPRAVVQAAEAIDDRFVAMQGLAAVSYSATFRGAFAEGEAALRRAEMIAREDEKVYRLIVVLGDLAINLALQGRVAETAALFEEARAAGRPYRDSVLVELETLNAPGSPATYKPRGAMAREAAAWRPRVTARRRAPGPAFGALAAIECGDVLEAERLVARARTALGERDWSLLPAGRALGASARRWHTPLCRRVRRGAGSRDRRACSRWTSARPLRWRCSTWRRPPSTPDDAAAAAAAADDLRPWRTSSGSLCIGGWRQSGRRARAWPGASPRARSTPRGCRSSCCRARAAPHTSPGPTTCSAARWQRTRGRGPSPSSSERRRSRSVRRHVAQGARTRGVAPLGHAGRRAAAAVLGPTSLTRREHEVARLAATGMSAKEIGESLFVGERTVESHLASVYAKLGVDSKLQLVRRAAELGLS